TKGEILVVSQFTLCADVTQGRRPSYTQAMKPEEAKKMYNLFIEELEKSGLPVETGEFGAMMEVQIHNDGPVTILIDSKKL
ncbi:D-tyrosyl-tRNA(Tyr) deacylase, partial [Candidatus Woesebacteria bacterium]|nr:D-tyrosyl-tRNA(Tyr) deacylase [Candidatus Woesebacteria bacterium]